MEDMSLLLSLLGLLLVIGAFVGVISGLLGVGGGIVLVPAFFYSFSALGYGSAQLMQICLATSLATIIVTSIRSVTSHNKRAAVDWRLLRGWAPGIVAGAMLGVLAAANLRSAALQGIFGFVGVLIGLYLLFGKPRRQLADDMPGGPLGAALSGGIGFLSVLMGIGGGAFAVPTMMLFGRPIHAAVATAAGFGVLIAVPSVTGFFFVQVPADLRPPLTLGAVNLPAFGVVICMTLITAPLGARLAHAMDPKPLKRFFAFFVMIVALNMLREVAGL